tara:strand:+ start:153 stop:1031 length:879 start_codon:yes stop_codon:yes gene_type:complete
MALTATQQKIEDAYQRNFGRGASFGTLGGADYWTDQIDNQGLSDSELDRILQASDEGVKYAADQVVRPGGVDPSMSMAANAAAGNTWARHFVPGGVFGANSDGTSKDLSNTIWAGLGTGADGNLGTDDAAGALNAIANATGTPINNLRGAYYNQGINAQSFTSEGDPIINDEIVTNTGGGSNQIDTSQFLTQQGLQDWWDALDKSAFTGNQQQQQGGMDDFMRFMMFMSMMRPQGGGYGGSQYGYGGLNPGGVMSAYNPMDNIASAISAFQSIPGIGTGNVNTGTTGGNSGN